MLLRRYRILSLGCILFLLVCGLPCVVFSQGVLDTEKLGDVKIAKLPIGMNLPELNYYTPALLFNDVMTTASPMFSYALGKDGWNSGVFNKFSLDGQGWPLESPQYFNGAPHGFRFLINNFYKGDYIVIYDGKGTLQWKGGVRVREENGCTVLTLNGKGGNVWVDITESKRGDHVRNMLIIPIAYKDNTRSMPLFYPSYIDGLRPFHAIRPMDLLRTNNSRNSEWVKRTKPNSYSQGLETGVAWEYVVDLANTLHADLWICIPHLATDEYIKKLAVLIHSQLNPHLKVYVEFSNEMWNWMFQQATYILNNAQGHPNAYVTSDLGNISPAGSGHPEKDAYMIARTFKIFGAVWSDRRDHLVTVAAIQVGWPDTFQRVMKYLFETDGVRADAISPTGYLCGISEENHKRWNAMDPAQVTPEMLLAPCNPTFGEPYTAVAETAKKYGIDIVVYEGGQHMQPFNQGEWKYNHAVYEAQISQGMYDRYMQNFSVMKQMGAKLFMAYSYISPREQKWGSWGHLEKLEDVNSPDLRTVAPKYQALLDANIPK